MTAWLWVFGDIEGLRWVARRQRMAFADHADRDVARMRPGDRAVLYLTRGAFHNPTRDRARLAGLATVTGAPHRRRATIAGREFTWQVPIRIDLLLPERAGPEVAPLAPQLSFVRRPEVWGQYFRRSPRPLTDTDFALLAAAVEDAARR